MQFNANSFGGNYEWCLTQIGNGDSVAFHRELQEYIKKRKEAGDVEFSIDYSTCGVGGLIQYSALIYSARQRPKSAWGKIDAV